MKIISYLICGLLLVTPILSASSSRDNIATTNVESFEIPKQNAMGVTDKNPTLKSEPSISMDCTAKITAKRSIAPLDPWDVLLEIDITQSEYGAGVGANPNYIYATEWSGSNIYYWNFDGVYQGSFTITGAANIRDLAYDHHTGHMWGGNGAGTCWEMDFTDQTLISTITGSWQCRAITYEREDDCLYVSGWGDPVWIIEKDGTILEPFNLVLTTSTYGFAYDKWDTNYDGILWVHDQGGTGSEIRAYDLEAGEFISGEDYYHNVQLEIPGAIAGGLALAEWGFGAYSSFVACGQASPDAIVVYETFICPCPEHDVAVKSINYPESGYADDDLPMQTTFRNNGNHTETFDAQMTVITSNETGEVIFYENFSTYGTGPNGLPENWTTDWWKWCNRSGNPCACVYYRDQANGGDYYDNYITTPKINCSGLEKVTLTFAMQHDVQYTCYFYLKYRPNESSPWKDITPWENPIVGDTKDWYTISIYNFQQGGNIGEAFQLNWSYHGYYNNFRNICLDDVKLESCRSSIEYAEIVEDITIPIGEEKTVDFPSWTPSKWQNESYENTYIEYPIKAEAFIDDDFPQNDEKVKLIELYFPWMHDVGSVTIEGLQSGPAQTFDLKGIIKNFGQNKECCFKTYIEIAEINKSNPDVMWTEDFESGSGNTPPLGWDIGISNPYAWSWTSNYSSYLPSPYGAGDSTCLYYYYANNAELISPEFNTSNKDALDFQFGNYIGHFTMGVNLTVEIRSDTNRNWVDITPWENPVTKNMAADFFKSDCTAGIGEKTQLRFSFNGNIFNFRYWIFDNIEIKGYNVFNPEYEDSMCIGSIEPQDERVLDFNNWTPKFLEEETTGTKSYLLKQWTELEDPPDRNPFNDLYQEVITLDFFHDVGVDEILSPYQPLDSRGKLFSQMVYGGTNWAAFTSSVQLGYLCDDDFYDVSKAFNEIEFYGLSLAFPWSNCDPNGMTFEIKVYEPGTVPGGVVYKESMVNLDKTRFAHNIYYSGFIVYHWEYCLEGDLKMEDGWISVQSDSSPNNCNFLWAISYSGNFNARQNGAPIHYSLAFNLTNECSVIADIYIQSGTQDIDVLVINYGTFPEQDMTCYTEIFEHNTNCTNGTIIYEDNITDIDIPTPLNGSKELNFKDFNFADEGLYQLIINISDDNDDNKENNIFPLGIGVDDTPPKSRHAINPPDPTGDNGWYVSDVEITLTAYDPNLPGDCDADGSGVNRIEYRIEGGSWRTLLGREGTFTFGDDGDDVLIEYRAIDNVGNEEDIKSFTIDMDQTSPVAEEITWEAYKKCGLWYVDLTASAVDIPSGMNRVEFFINKGHFTTIEGSGPTYVFTIQWSLDFPKLSLYFYHYDNAGNVIMVYFDPHHVEAVPQPQTQQQLLNTLTRQKY